MGDIKTRFAIEGEQQFKSAMSNAASAIKVLNSEQKLAKAQFENTGNAEKYAADQARILKEKIEQQKTAVKAAEQALKQLSDNGVAQNSRQFQQWQTKLNNAQTALVQMETELQNVGSSMDSTSSKADQMSNSLDSIGKKVSLDAVSNGIGKITDKLEAAAQKAKELGTQLINSMRESASWADDLQTDATVYGMDAEQLQRMRAAAWKFDTSVEAIIQSQQKLENNMVRGSKETKAYFQELGVAIETFSPGKYGSVSTGFRDWEDVFWETGEALMSYGNAVERDVMAQAIFGRSWRDLLPLFKAGKDAYYEFMSTQDVVSQESIDKLTALDDAWNQMQTDWNVMKNTIFSELSPSFKSLAETVSGLLKEFNAYLETDEGKQKLNDLGEAVSGLFTKLTDIDFGAALETAKGALNSLTEGLQWLSENGETVKGVLEGVVLAWGGLKLAGGAADLLALVNGLKGFTASSASAAGTAAGSAWGSAFAAAVTKAAPWLAFAYTLLNPAETASNDWDVLFDEKTGKLTSAGWQDWYNNPDNWTETLKEVGDIFGDLARITSDENAINAMARYRMSGDLDTLIREMESLGYIKKLSDDELRNKTGIPETVRVDDNGYMYDAEGNRIGFQMPKSDGPAYHRDRRTGELTEIVPPEIINARLPESGEVVGLTEEQLSAVERMWDALRTTGDFTDADFDAYEKAFEGQAELFKMIDDAMDHLYQTNNWDEESLAGLPEDLLEIEAKPTLPTDAGSLIQEKLNQLRLTAIVNLIPSFPLSDISFFSHANGLPYVPFNGYPAILHKGERVLTAREATTYNNNNSSNLYVEHMSMSNGMDADALAEAMAARQQRLSAGYGS